MYYAVFDIQVDCVQNINPVQMMPGKTEGHDVQQTDVQINTPLLDFTNIA